jgi:hypothetical protein
MYIIYVFLLRTLFTYFLYVHYLHIFITYIIYVFLIWTLFMYFLCVHYSCIFNTYIIYVFLININICHQNILLQMQWYKKTVRRILWRQLNFSLLDKKSSRSRTFTAKNTT